VLARRRRAAAAAQGRSLWGYAYAAPIVALVGVFVVYPVGSIVYHSFTRWDGIAPAKWIGVANYSRLIHDSTFHTAIQNNLLFALAVPLWVIVPLVVAVLIYERIPGWRFFRATVFIPAVLSTVVVGILWSAMLGFDGPLNTFLRSVGLGGLAHEWLADAKYSIPAIMVVVLWAGFGYNTLIFLAGLAAIDTELFDAARVDGAGWWQTLWNVTIPSLRRTIELVTVLNVIGAFAYMFTYVYVITGGGPGFDTYVTEYYVYQQAFNFGNMGYASAVGVFLMVITIAVAVLQVRILVGRRGA
jgi:ABC-type sugar transport system permease subunit